MSPACCSGFSLQARTTDSAFCGKGETVRTDLPCRLHALLLDGQRTSKDLPGSMSITPSARPVTVQATVGIFLHPGAGFPNQAPANPFPDRTALLFPRTARPESVSRQSAGDEHETGMSSSGLC